MPPVVLSALGDAGVKDLRSLYRAAVCARLSAGHASCDEVLRRFPGEDKIDGRAGQRNPAEQYRIGFVPGIFADCMNGVFHPFTDAIQELRQKGFEVSDFRIPGRGAAAQNADHLAKQLDEIAADPLRLILVVYSKGLPDVLELLLRHPRQADRIAAIVSVAGVSGGSPVADRMEKFYRRWLASLPLPGCEGGTGAEVHDLRRDVRVEWWSRNRSAVKVPIFSLVAVPNADRVSPILAKTYGELSEIDPRNDGQLLWYDAVVPHGYLLGYVNADHLAIAIPLAEQAPLLKPLFRDNVPRPALIEAAIEVVARTVKASQ